MTEPGNKKPLNDVTFTKRLMKGPFSPFDPNLIKEVFQNYLVPPSLKQYNLILHKDSSYSMKYNSYKKQVDWKFLHEETKTLFPPSETRGFYVEVGAFDGEYLSNSLFLELYYKWNGLLIEPDKGLYQSLLKKQRKAWSCHCCLSTKPYPHQTILSKIDSGNGDPLSMNQRIYSSISESRTNKERDKFGSPVYETVQCIPLHTLLVAINQTHVDVIYLDVEDVEVELLSHFDYGKIDVDVWIIEHRHPKYAFGIDSVDQDFIMWFESLGHILYKVAPYFKDYIFIKKNSNFYIKNKKRLHL